MHKELQGISISYIFVGVERYQQLKGGGGGGEAITNYDI